MGAVSVVALQVLPYKKYTELLCCGYLDPPRLETDDVTDETVIGIYYQGRYILFGDYLLYYIFLFCVLYYGNFCRAPCGLT